ncbi:MAG: PKD domain-containing protein [Thermoplasmatota archaeon]
MLRIKRKHILLVLMVGCVLLIIIAFFIIGESGTEDNNMDFSIIISEKDPRVGETITFNTNISDSDVDYQWDFGDGDTSKNNVAYHVYEKSGQYLVTLNITGLDIKTNHSTIIKVYNNDIVFEKSGDFMRNFLPGVGTGYNKLIELKESINPPEVEFEVKLQNAYGDFGFVLDIFNYEDSELQTIFHEEHTSYGEDIIFRGTISADEINEFLGPGGITLEIYILKGRCANWSIDISIKYLS